MVETLKPGADVALADGGRADKGPKIREAGRERMSNMAEGAKNLAGNAAQFMKDDWNQTGKDLQGGWNWLKQKAGGIWGGVKEGGKAVLAGGKAAVEFAFGAPEAIKAAGKGVKAAAEYDVGKKAAEGKDFVMRKASEGYESLAQKGQEVYGKARGRVIMARNKFDGWRNERRMAKVQMLEQKQEAKKHEVAEGLKAEAIKKMREAGQLFKMRAELLKVPAAQLSFK